MYFINSFIKILTHVSLTVNKLKKLGGKKGIQ